jgi:hypothetical protein
MGKYCYGKIPSKERAGRVLFGAVAALAQLPDPPAEINETADLTFEMFENDGIGDCTAAELGNQTIAQTALATGTPVVIPVADVVAFYSAISGYDPATGENDNGADEDAVMERFQTVGLGRYKSAGSVNIDPRNFKHLMQARWVFGAFALGLALPKSAEEQFAAGQPWTVPWYSPFAGYHEVAVVDYTSEGLIIVTWAGRTLMTWPFAYHYATDAHVAASNAYLRADGTSPGHLDLIQLVGDLPYVQG